MRSSHALPEEPVPDGPHEASEAEAGPPHAPDATEWLPPRDDAHVAELLTRIVHQDEAALAALYQLRGRVGRSDRAAYAYLLIPPEEALSPVARKRLSAIKEFSDLGSGFRVAALVLVYMLFVLRGFRIAHVAQDGFSKLLAAGLTDYARRELLRTKRTESLLVPALAALPGLLIIGFGVNTHAPSGHLMWFHLAWAVIGFREMGRPQDA